jgi:hypothetical protein
MEIVKEQCLDASEQDEDGYYDYYYAYFYYHFKSDTEDFEVRQYEDTPEEASFMAFSVMDKGIWQRHLFDAIPYDNALFCKAVHHLVEHEGVRHVKILLNGYTKVNIKKATKTL